MTDSLIAVVDNDWTFLELMDALLRDEGYRTVHATTVADGMALVSVCRPDMVMLDTWIATQDDGCTLLEHIRRDARLHSVPVLVCTADSTCLVRHAELLQRHRCAVLEKPFDIASLLTIVADLISERRSPHPSPLAAETALCPA
jgi:DNA-binding NtrC family response regulator